VSLKNPKDLPKIPKTRKKKAHIAIKAIPEKKPDKHEYKCKAFYHFEESTDSQLCVFRIETVAEFTNFVYEIVVDTVQEKRDLYFVLMGLKAKANALPHVEPAITDLALYDLVGEYNVNIVKQDGAINSAVFKFNPYKKEIELVKEFQPQKKNNRFFCKFEVAEELFTFQS
jgi:hypothetical protein